MTGEEALAYIHNVPWQGTRLGLVRTQELMELLDHPEEKLRFIHIAGTNGKGSTAAMTASVLTEAGYRTGMYISPFLQVFHERMTVDGVQITGEELGFYTEKVKEACEKMEDPPTEFEMMTALAFLFFAGRNCDFVVLEVGLGGRLDSTNVIPVPEVAVICNIGLDHVKELGDTLEKIAFEKAGIIKENGRAVLYSPEAESVRKTVTDLCRQKNASLRETDFSELTSLDDSIEGQTFSYRGRQYRIRLLGAHQLRNAAVVLETVEVLRSRSFVIGDDAVAKGLEKAVWPGRFEVLRTQPVFIADGGHNLQCAKSVADSLEHYFPGREVTFVMGVLADKDYEGILEILAPLGKRFYTLPVNSPRALSPKVLAELIKVRYNKPVDVCESAADAVARALAGAEKDDVICSVGSLYMTGEIRTALLK